MTGKRKKRFWSDEEKQSICQQASTSGVSVAQVARRYAMNANSYLTVDCAAINEKADFQMAEGSAVCIRSRRGRGCIFASGD